MRSEPAADTGSFVDQLTGHGVELLAEDDRLRFRHVEVVGEPVRVKSSFVKGFQELPVRVHPV